MKKFLIAYFVHYVCQTHADAIFLLNPNLEKSNLRYGMVLAHYVLGKELTDLNYKFILNKKENTKLSHVLGFVAATFTCKLTSFAKPYRWIMGIK